ncbi:MAG TPA: penicillin acylase family protein, partial [Pseudomonadales bacterium]|nr:penicillin acylase family protein [Pseudomonadales bacterium]
MTCSIPEADAPLEICWDKVGVPHIFASTVEDAFRGMGYACASERLWQLHLSNLFATGTAASVMGERFVTQDLMHKAFHVPAYNLPDSPGDYIVDAYLQGVNAYIANLDEVPPEFVKAGTEPRMVTRHDVASRYRFTGWFQQKTWLEKIYLGKLMALHGIDWFKNNARRFSVEDAECIEMLKDELLQLDINIAHLLFPVVPGLAQGSTPASSPGLSGSNNWAIAAELSASGYPMLATDPHQPHGIPNTFFYSHLSAPGLTAFGASFPGVPYFMMGFNQDLAWGLTTGCVDTYDVFIEKDVPQIRQTYEVEVANEPGRRFTISRSGHGPILESLTDALGITKSIERSSVTALDWVMRDKPTSAGALALLPLARNSEEFGAHLFENDVCPLVNNIICVDRNNDMRRFMATTIRKRQGVTGIVPLPGWKEEYFFDTSLAEELLVEHNPDSGYTLTANNDTMGDRGAYPLHNYPAHDARARRIEQLLIEAKSGISVEDFTAMQLDLLDLRAKDLVPGIVSALTDESEEVQLAKTLLSGWDCIADINSKAACIFYPLLDKRWHTRFMQQVLGKNPLFVSMPFVAPGLNRLSIEDFMQADSPWLKHREAMEEIICNDVRDIVQWLRANLGDDWTWGKLHQISFRNSLAKYDTWEHMQLGPDAIGGSPTTLAMTVHNPPRKG